MKTDDPMLDYYVNSLLLRIENLEAEKRELTREISKLKTGLGYYFTRAFWSKN